MQNYAGTPDDQGLIVIPEDLDVADAESVNRSFRALRDNAIAALSAAAGMPLYPFTRMRCLDGVKIDILPLPRFLHQGSPFSPYKYLFPVGGKSPITVANLDTLAGNFELRKPYYVYLGPDLANAGKYKYYISRALPSESLNDCKTNAEWRFIGSFMTDANAAIQRFRKVGVEHVFGSTAKNNLLFQQSANAWTTLDLTQSVPPHALCVKLRCEIYNYNQQVDLFHLRVKGDTEEQTITIGHGDGGASSVQNNTVDLDVVLDDTQQLEWKFDRGAGVQGGFVTMSIRSYLEG